MQAQIDALQRQLAAVKRMRVQIVTHQVAISGSTINTAPTVGRLEASGDDIVLILQDK
jgi:hypothetical protein